MNRNIWIGVIGIVVLGGGAWWYFSQTDLSATFQTQQNTTSNTQPTVNNQPSASEQTPAASAKGFSASPTSGPAPLTVTFSNIPATAAEEDISFGDGQEASNGSGRVSWGTAPGGSVTHTYTKPGTYTVVIQGSMSNGELGRLTVTVTN